MKVSPQKNVKKILRGISFGQIPIHTPHDSGKYIITETRVCVSPARPDRGFQAVLGDLGSPSLDGGTLSSDKQPRLGLRPDGHELKAQLQKYSV